MEPNTLRILSIEDSLADARILKAMLSQARPGEFSLTHVETAEAGLQAIEHNEFDCVFLDYRLEDDSGLNVLRSIRGAGSDIPVIALSGNGNEAVAVAALKLGAQDYMVKNAITPEAVERALTNALERVQLTREVADRQRELEDFAHIAAHDLRAPLSSVGMFVDWLRDDMAEVLTDQQREVLGRILSINERMARLLDSLLEYAETGRSNKQLQQVSLNDVMEVVVDNLEFQIRRVDATVNYGSLPTVKGDKVALVQLLQNLIANALKFKSERPPVIEVAVTQNENRWNVRVSDNGIGIKQENLSAIFAPFRRLHNKADYEGSGIGLATCKRIAEQHGGQIRVESEWGRGSAFHFTLPAVGQSPSDKSFTKPTELLPTPNFKAENPSEVNKHVR